MANIDKLNFSFTDGQTTITANHLNSFVDRINKLIDAVGGDTPTPTQTVATPTIHISGTTATISCSTSGATIYYTLNGNTPTTSSTQYTGAITLSDACTIKAIAVKSGMNNSSVASQSYTPSVVATPVISISGNSATITCATSGAQIRYTLDGTTPTANSTLYSSAITLSQSCTIKAIAIKSGMNNSEVASRQYAPAAVTYPIQGTGSAIKMPLSDIGSRPQSDGVAGDIIYFEATTQNFGIYRGNESGAYNGKCTIVWDDATHGHVDWSHFGSTHIGIVDPVLAVGETITFISNGHENS